MELITLTSVYEAKVVKRPSKISKTPYVADVVFEGSDDEYMAHTAALGCCGMVDKDKSVIMIDSPNKNNVCSYKIMLAISVERGIKNIIGVDPKIAEDLVENAINQNLLSKLKNVKKYKREQVISNSRFDFIGLDENQVPFIMEVKNVPLADYEDVPKKERKNYDFTGREFDSKVAYFPDGYRKNRNDPVSPRALKHVQELTKIRKISKVRCLLGFVIQRSDVSRFQASVIDPQYKDALKIAIESGVEVFAMVVKWNTNGVAEFVRDDLPVVY